MEDNETEFKSILRYCRFCMKETSFMPTESVDGRMICSECKQYGGRRETPKREEWI